jgi:hypothetical protein
MRSAGNFSPEWGYLAPAPSFMRTVRVVLIATAVGATAGAAVVLSLVDRPAGGEATAVAAHAIVTSAQAAAAPALPAPSVPVAVVTSSSAATPIIATPDVAKAPAVASAPIVAAVAAPQIAEPPAPIAPQAAAMPAENSGATETAPERRAAPGMAALSDASPTASDAAASDIAETPAIAVEGPLPQKKVKRAGPASAKSKSNQTLGSVFGSLFNPHH